MYQERLRAQEAIAKELSKKDGYAATLGLGNGVRPEVVPVTHYVTAKIEGKTIELVDSSKNKVVGIQSFDSDKLPAGKPFILAGITGLYANAVTDAETPETADYSDSAPAVLLNGELKIDQEDKGNLVDVLFDSVINNNTTPNVLDREFKIANMPVLRDKVSFSISGKMPTTLATGTDHFIKIALRGYSIRSAK